MKPSIKAKRRLERRIAGYGGGNAKEWRIIPAPGPGAQTYHRPGSQNRNK